LDRTDFVRLGCIVLKYVNGKFADVEIYSSVAEAENAINY